MHSPEAGGQPIRLLMLSHYFDERRGGIEQVARALASELCLQGFRLTWCAAGTAESQSQAGNSECYRVPLAASNVAETLLKVPYPLLLPSAWRRIFMQAKVSDVVMAHDALYMTSIVGYLAARAYRKPFVAVQHVGVVPYHNRFLRGLMAVANRLVAVSILRRADRVIFISELTMRHFARVRWRRPPTLIFNGVDTDIFSPAANGTDPRPTRESLGLPFGVPVALFVGRFVEKKGLQVLERLARRFGDVVFAFAGQGTLDPVNWGLPNVRVFRSLSGTGLAALYRASDLLLLPSVGEGFPLVVQEALACGLTVICGADTARADSRAESFIRGIAVDLENPDQTARLFSEEMTRALAERGSEVERARRFEFAKSNYSWRASAASYASTLRSLC
jgi:alpha-maltose-1-phosphate synthase